MIVDRDKKLGQLFVVGFEGYTLTKEIKSFLRIIQPGGIILFECNIRSKKQVQELINDINKTLDTKPFITVDQEGGSVERLRNICTQVPSLWGLSKVGLEEVLFSQKIIINDLIDLGFNMNLAPVLDINSNKENPVIGTRSLSNNPQIVSEYGYEIVKLYLNHNVIPVIKHFPGHGDVNVDSHLALPVLNKSKKELLNFELIPFINVAKIAPCIMVAHLALPKITNNNIPASLSKTVLKDMIRNDLNYKGLIITDELNMKGVNLPIEKASFETLLNGSDLLLYNHESKQTLSAFRFLKLESMKNKQLAERIDESYIRVIDLKKKFFSKKLKKAKITNPEKLSNQLASKVVHWIKKDLFFKKITKKNKIEVIYPITPKLKEYYLMDILVGIKEKEYSLLPYEMNPSKENINEILNNLKEKSVKVLITYDSHVRRNQKILINKLLEKHPNIILISIGLEYDMELSLNIKNFIAAYAPNQNCLKAAFDLIL